MKKAISILLAAATLAFATSAMAATSTGTVANQSSNTTFVSDPTSYSSMPCFRPGDSVSFTISSDETNIAEGTDITLITYKHNQTKSDSTVQYINQYTATGSGDAVNYIVRDIDTGVYQLDIKVGTNALYTVYYKIGNVDAVMIPSNGNEYAYIIRNNGDGTWSAGFVGKVTVDTPNITLSDIGSEPGFAITIDGNRRKFNFTASQVAGSSLENTAAYASGDALTDAALSAGSELYGGYSFVYGMTIYNITSSGNADAIMAEAITDAE